MSISISETNMICGRLEATGWRREVDRLVAPHGTMWLHFAELGSFGTACELRERMHGRLERILANRDKSCAVDAEQWRRSHDDAISLVECLDSAFGCEHN